MEVTSGGGPPIVKERKWWSPARTLVTPNLGPPGPPGQGTRLIHSYLIGWAVHENLSFTLETPPSRWVAM